MLSGKNKKSLYLFDTNACSLSKIFFDFHPRIQSANIDFDVIAISESRIIKNKPSVVDKYTYDNGYKYTFEFCPTESSAGILEIISTLLYWKNHLL